MAHPRAGAGRPKVHDEDIIEGDPEHRPEPTCASPGTVWLETVPPEMGDGPGLWVDAVAAAELLARLAPDASPFVVLAPGARHRPDSAGDPGRYSLDPYEDGLLTRLQAAVASGADLAVTVVPVVDAVKRVVDGAVAENVDRSVLRAVQPPAIAHRRVLELALGNARVPVAGVPVAGVPVASALGALGARRRPVDLLAAAENVVGVAR